jgi:hypothetical protein
MHSMFVTLLSCLIAFTSLGCSKQPEPANIESASKVSPVTEARAKIESPPKVSPVTDGEREAERDIASGILKLKAGGLPAPWIGDYIRLLKARFGVQLDFVAGCIMTEELSKNMREYNTRMEREIATKFGSDALEKLSDEVEKNYWGPNGGRANGGTKR